MVFNDVIDKIGMTIDAAGVVVIVTGAAIAFVVTAVIPYPQSDHHRLPGRPGRVPRDLEQARGGKNTTPGSSGAPTPGRWPGPARRVGAAAAAQIAGRQQDPAAQNVHAAISASP